MKLLPMNYHYLRYPLSKFLDFVESSPFIQEIDLYCAAPQLDVFHVSLKKLLDVDRELQQRDIQVNTMTPENFAYPVNFCTDDKELTHASLKYYQRAVDIADFLGCPRVQISIGTGYFSEKREESWKRCKENLGLLASYCERKKITLLLEELKTTSSNVINSSAELARILQEVDSPYLKGMMDIDQMAEYGETPRDYFSALGSKLQHIHFNDCGHTVPGDGRYPMKQYYDEIVESGYDGTLSFEICAREYFQNPDAAMNRILKWLKANT